MCPECGLQFDPISPKDAVVAVRSFPRRYRALLVTPGSPGGPDAVFRRRPDPKTWSALEYTAHVADQLDLLGPIIRRVMVEEHPSIDLLDYGERAVQKGYNQIERAEVLGWLELACGELAGVLESVRADDWTRTAVVEAGERDALALARNGVHEGSHHLRDVQRVLNLVRGRPG